MFRKLADKLIESFRADSEARLATRLDDLVCLDSDAEYEVEPNGEPTDRLRYIWFKIVERPFGGREWRGFRVIRISELRYLPQEARADASLIAKQAGILRGLYSAGIELLTVHFGVFDPPLGIIQCYGAIGRHETLEVAIRKAEAGHAAVIAAMTAQYPQSRFAALNGRKSFYLGEALHRMPHVTALVGQPDPREGVRGGGQQQTQQRAQATTFSEQQNEVLFRALARAKEEFLFMNIATPIDRRDLAAMLESLANLTSPIASRQQGASSIGFGVSLPVILSLGQAQAAGQAYGESEGRGSNEGVGVSHGTSHTEGVADSGSWSYTKGVAHTEGVAETDSISHTSGVTRSYGVSHGSSEGWGTSDSISKSHGTSVAHTQGSFASATVGGSHTESSGSNWSHGGGVSSTVTDPGMSYSANIDLGDVPLIGKIPVVGAIGGGISDNLTPTTSTTIANNWSVGGSSGVADTSSWASSSGSSQSTTVGESWSEGVSHGVSHSLGVSESVSEGVAYSESDTVGHATTHSQAVSNSEGWSVGGSHTRSSSDGVSDSVGASQGRSYSYGVSQGRTLGVAQTQGLSAGVSPSASISKSFQWKDEAAAALTKLLEEQMNVLSEASEEGGFYSDVFVFNRTATGQRIAEAAAVQAFGGSQGVVTHLQPRRPANAAEKKHLKDHARTITPSTLVESLGWINGYAYSSILTPTQQASYGAPGLFEEGTALTVQERVPPFAFAPDMPGDADLGFLFSTERGEVTDARVRITEDRHFHTLFAADTGFGKTVAAERLAVEAVKCWQHRVVVLDFGAGWRRMINGPLPAGRVDLYQLFPGSIRPFRWNFLRIGRRMDPNRQYAATAELIANAGKMGPRQLGYIKRALWELYVEAGVMTAEPSVYNDPVWGAIIDADEGRAVEQAAIERGLPPGRGRLPGSRLIDLLPFERQALAVYRSRKVHAGLLYERLKKKVDDLPKGDVTARTSLEGILLRLEPFTHGELAMMYCVEESLAIEDLGLIGREPNIADRYGLCVLEGGAEMDEYAKALVLALAAWHLYNDSVVRRRETIGGFNRPLDIFFEEANKILSGAATTEGNNEAGGGGVASAAALWQQMWRDGRKYRIFLHPIVQTLSELPPGIQPSCNNAFFGQLKGPLDRDMAVSHLARSERGFTDEEYKRFISRIPVKLAIVKLGYSADVADMEPMLCQPARVPGIEPTDVDILWELGRLT